MLLSLRTMQKIALSQKFGWLVNTLIQLHISDICTALHCTCVFDCKHIHALNNDSTYKAASCLTRALNRRYQIDQLTVLCATPVDGHHGYTSAKKHARLSRASVRYHCAIKHPNPWALIFSVHATGKIYLFCSILCCFQAIFPEFSTARMRKRLLNARLHYTMSAL